MISYLVWDAGGTLFDTYPAVVAACRAALRSLGYEASTAWLMSLFRQTTAFALETIADRFGIPLTSLESAFGAAYDAVEPDFQPPFPFVRHVCAYMCGVGGWNYIVTHRGRESLEGLLQAHSMADYFVDWITKEDPFPRKPDPASFLGLMARHGLDPSSGMVIGDRPLDIVAGQRAGLSTCWYGEPPEGTEPDLSIVSYDQLLLWLQVQHQGAKDESCGVLQASCLDKKTTTRPVGG
ncbi:MAG: HAD hydrolase-like protein [Anaerolineae bacterium]